MQLYSCTAHRNTVNRKTEKPNDLFFGGGGFAVDGYSV